MIKVILPLVVGILLAMGSEQVFAQSNGPTLRLDEETRKLLREVTEDKWFKKDALFGTVIGGLIATFAGIGASLYAHRLDVNRQETEDAEFESNVLRAIRRELEALHGIYLEGSGRLIRELVEGQTYNTFFVFTQDYFAVFNANAVHLGKIDADISRHIVSVYTYMKLLIEEFGINNDLLNRQSEVDADLNLNPTDPQLQYRAENIHSQLVARAILIRNVDQRLQTAFTELLQLLDKRGVKQS